MDTYLHFIPGRTSTTDPGMGVGSIRGQPGDQTRAWREKGGTYQPVSAAHPVSFAQLCRESSSNPRASGAVEVVFTMLVPREGAVVMNPVVHDTAGGRSYSHTFDWTFVACGTAGHDREQCHRT
jgi:hypothetical protein